MKYKRKPKLNTAQLGLEQQFWRGAKHGFEMAADYLIDEALKAFTRDHDIEAKALRSQAYAIRTNQVNAASNKIKELTQEAAK